MCIGDIHNIAEEVQKFDPHYFLELNPVLGKYQVLERRARKMRDGTLNGFPLFSFSEVCEVVMTIDFIDAEKEPPDMRIVYDLYKNDLWRYPGGPEAFYEDMMRESEQTKQKREEAFGEMVNYTSQERHKYIMRELEGAPDLKTLHQGVNLNGI